MKWVIAAAVGILAMAPAGAGSFSSGVYEAHDKFPQRIKEDKDCDNCSCLSPDGDHDCDDGGGKGVAEPGDWTLLVFGMGLIAVRMYRKKGEIHG